MEVTRLASDYLESSDAQGIPSSFLQGGGWMLLRLSHFRLGQWAAWLAAGGVGEARPSARPVICRELGESRQEH